MNIRKLLTATAVLALSLALQAAPTRRPYRLLFDEGWRFAVGDYPEAAAPDYDDSAWRTLDLPHDWSIESSPDAAAPSGNDGGYYATGIGWYRKTFTLPKAPQGTVTSIYFEGVYMNAEVYINGHPLGVHPYGYTPFSHDLTPYLNDGGKNVIAVRVDNARQKNCRWYSGSGIYRHVWLQQSGSGHFTGWGVGITTSQVDSTRAVVRVGSDVTNGGGQPCRVVLTARLLKEDVFIGSPVESEVQIAAGDTCHVEQTFYVDNPALWSVDSPNLYRLLLTVQNDGDTVDERIETFGIRTIAYNADEGFLLNGKPLTLHGGCMHHDNGILGAAAYDRAEERKVELLKEAGFNAVRTSHNPPSEAMLAACDRLGLLVIDEAFDGWREQKTPYDYSTLFDTWWQRDVETMVLRDRNHPAVFCWSVGNEVIERKRLEVLTTAKRLIDCVHRLDPTRPVTSALASWDSDWEIYDPLAALHDIAGYNYLLHYAEADHLRVPSRLIIQTESYPRDAFINRQRVEHNSYILGDFVWTAVDYLGESGIGRYYYEGETPGEHYERDQYPWHGAYCGDIDLTGWRKPISHYRDLLYNSEVKLYMAVREPDGYHGTIRETLWSVYPTWESWNWPGHEGKPIEVEVCSRYPKVCLYLNGEQIDEALTGEATAFKALFTLPYRPGILEAAGVDADGMEQERVTLRTAATPAKLRLCADRTTLQADGEDLCYITVEVTDADGIIDPNADNALTFSVKGAGTLIAAGNADLQDTASYQSTLHKAWKGRALAVVKSMRRSGKITLTVSSPGLPSATLTLEAK
ncbi:MAG: DUF4982 domain-containing protein [Prevotellaceae bacterium]|nr:DUF4982 domain-containing protein [Prevotellaceae bacterium]